MPLNLYLSTAESPRNALVASQLNPVPIKIRDLIKGDVLAVNLYIVDGYGNFDPRSGTDATPWVALGLPGQTPIFLNTTWAQIDNGWTGSLQTTAAGFDSQFALTGMNPIQLSLDVKLQNLQGILSSVAQIPILVFNDQLVGTPNADIFVNAILGSFRLTQGQDVYTVTALNLVTAPVSLLLHPIRKPSGGLSIGANPVDGTLTADGFSFTLTGQPDSADYWLDYVITFSNSISAAPPSAINYAGPPLVVPPLLASIVVDINYRQWQYGPSGWL